MGRQIPTECIHGVILDSGDFDAQIGKCQICDGEVVMDDRIKLAKAMKLEIYSRGADTYPLRKLHNNLMQPFDPYTDANDDVAVLEWAREKLSPRKFVKFSENIANLLIGLEKKKPFDALCISLTTEYKIGFYAKAAVLVLDRA